MPPHVDFSTDEDLFYELTGIQILIDDCERLLKKWRATKAHRSDASADAVTSIIDLKDMLRVQARAIKKELGDDQLPF